MANEPVASFNVDAGQLIAKLHLAGKTQAPNCTVVNSGIKDEKKSDKPEAPNKCTFDMTNKGGQYEVAFIKFGIEQKATIDVDKVTELKKKKDDIEKAKNEHKDETESIAKLYNDYNKAIIKLGVKDIKPESSVEEVNEAIKATNEEIIAENKKTIDDLLKKDVQKEVDVYFKTFCGEKNYKPISIDKYVKMQFGSKVTDDPSTVEIDNFIIQGIDKKELTALQENAAKDPSKSVEITIGFKVGFTLGVTAM